MGKITDRNITGIHEGKFAALQGDAHQYIATGILMRLGFDVAVVVVKGQPYDLMISAYKEPHGERVLLRCQTRTISHGSIKFTAGERGGVNRVYIPGVKKYKYTTEHNDLIIGVDPNTLDLYLVPTRFIGYWGDSKAISKLQQLKNNWGVLLNWNDEYLNKLKDDLLKQKSFSE